MGAAGLFAGAQFAGSLIQGIGQINAGKAALEAGRRANEQAMMNAELLETLGVLKAGEIRRARGRVVSQRTVAFAKGGVNPDTGTPLDVSLDAALEDELAALNAKFGFDSQAFQQIVQGQQALFQGQVQNAALKAQGINSIASGLTSAAITFSSLKPTPAKFEFSGIQSTSILPATGGPSASNILDLSPVRGNSSGLTRFIT